MEAEQDQAYEWTLTKTADPAQADFGDTCQFEVLPELTTSITIEWERTGPAPAGEILVTTRIYATNPAHRTITVNVTDVIRSGTDVLDTLISGDVDVAAGTSDFLVLEHSFSVDAGTTDLNDVATASYIDKLTGVAVPGTTEATASATVVFSGTTLNETATLTDTESISGANLSFSVADPSVGSFVGYVANTKTTGPVNWESGVVSGSGSVTFDKTIYLSDPTIITDGQLSDMATLVGSDGFGPLVDTAEVDIFADATVSVTIEKTIPDILQGAETVTFNFNVLDASDQIVASPSITFAAGETSKSVTVSGLDPGSYTVEELAVAGWEVQFNQSVAINLPDCEGSASFENTILPASAQVRKVTYPAGFEAGWEFTLNGPGGPETVSTTGAGFVDFALDLQEGAYTITETGQPGWIQTDSSAECSFTVDYPADANRVFECTFENTYDPSVEIDKSGDLLSKIGDEVTYTIEVTNTSVAPGPSLECTVSDPTLGFNQVVTLAAGASQSWNVPFTIPAGATDPFPNTASVECTYPGLSDVVASDSDGHEINLFQPAIAVDKTGDAYSKAGDTVNYTVTLSNNSSADTPALDCVAVDSLTGTVFSGILPPGNTVVNPSYVVQQGDPDPLVNTVTLTCSPVGFPNVLEQSASHTVDLLHPSFTVSKVCVAEPVSYLGPANFTVTIANTGDVELIVTADDGIGTFPLAAGTQQSFPVSVPGPFTPGGTVENTVNASWTLPGWTGLANADSLSATDYCDVMQVQFETAYAQGDDGVAATCFTALGAGNWGWVNGPIGPGNYNWPLIAGAGGCVGGTVVGSVDVNYDGTNVSVIFHIDAQYIAGDTHVYAGTSQVPPGGFAPGQFQIYGPFNGEEIYVIAHAVVGIPQ